MKVQNVLDFSSEFKIEFWSACFSMLHTSSLLQTFDLKLSYKRKKNVEKLAHTRKISGKSNYNFGRKHMDNPDLKFYLRAIGSRFV
jgi:hypothetical protein